MKRVLTFMVAVLVAFLLMLGPAQGVDNHSLTVDGVTYSPTKVTGGAVHYETPDVNPTTAFSERHTWEGNGSENLPCEGGIHWIDNENVLTVSHCLEVTPPETTTTTEAPPETTTTVPETTTTVPEVTTTTVTDPCDDGDCGTTSTTEPDVPTTTSPVPPTPTTTPPSAPPAPELPMTGPGETLMVIAAIGAFLVGTGALLLRFTRRA